MNNNFKAVGISYTNAPIEIREKVALDEQAGRRLLRYFKEFTSAQDILVLSTCNRTEVYYTSEDNLNEDIIKLIGIENHIADINLISPYFFHYNNHHAAVDHLFKVAMGLEAQVVGDMQISNQVKRAYQWSADEDLAGPFLHRLMHTIFFTNKRVVQETSFRDGAASVSYAATELVSALSSELERPRILVLGLGEIGEDVCKNLMDPQNSREVLICNRTRSKAEALAAVCGFSVTPFENVREAIQNADVIISSVAASEPLITKELVTSLDILSYKYFIDLSVPRSIDTEIENIPGALLYNIDNIRQRANEALEKRLNSVPAVELIIEQSIAEFNQWSKEMVVSPTIQKFKQALEDIRQQEMARYLKNMDASESKAMEKVTKSMMQKIIKLPVLQLKAACQRGDAENLIGVLNDLFNLEQEFDKKQE